MFFYFVIVLLTLSYLWLRNRYSYWERLGVPGPKPVYLFGNLFKQLTFQEHISEAHHRWHNTYRDVPYLGFYKLLQPAVMIRDLDFQREILVKDFMHFNQNDAIISEEDHLLKMSPFYLIGEEWRQSREFYKAFFSLNKVKAVFPAMLKVANEWEQYVRSLGTSTEIDAKDICRRFSTEAMLRCTFSIDGKSFEGQSEFLDMGESVFNDDMITAIKSMAAFFIPVLQKYLSIPVVSKTMDRRFRELTRQQLKLRDSKSVRCDDMLQVVLNAREKYQVTESQIAGLCLGFFVEAYDTSSDVLAVALYTLANNPHIQDELARRIQESLVANNNEITYDLVHKHEYLDKVAAECLRIRTPSPLGIQRLCTKAYTMPLLPGQSEPTTIPVGTPLLIPFSTVQQDPAYYSDPELFDPERFSPEQKAQRNKSAHMPFSDGPRMCSGMNIGLFNLKMGLFQLIRRFDVKLHPKHKLFKWNPMSFFNFPLDEIRMILTPRKKV